MVALLSLSSMAEFHATANLLDSVVAVNPNGSYREKHELTYNASGDPISYAYYNRWNNITEQWIGQYKEEYIYDDNGNEVLYAYYRYWDSTIKQWEGHSKNEYAYDNNGNRILHVYYSWNGETSQWVELERRKYEYTYDNHGNQTLCVTSILDIGAEQWEETRKNEYTYDNNGNQTLETRYYWNSTIEQWVVGGISESTYDNNGNQTIHINHSGNENGLWGGLSKYEYAYDDNNRQTLIIFYDWTFYSDSDVGWVERSKNEYAYDNNGNQTMEATYVGGTYYGNVDTRWVGEYKQEYAYDDNGSLILYIESYWNNETNHWREHSKREYVYNDNNNEVQRIYYDWNIDTDQLVEVYRFESEYTYNTDGDVSTRKQFYSYPDGELIHHYTEYLYYSAYELSDIDTPQLTNTVQVYLNSIVNTLYIKVENSAAIQAFIYNLQGQLLLQTNQTEIDLSAYPAGIYIVKVNAGAETVIQKIIKK